MSRHSFPLRRPWLGALLLAGFAAAVAAQSPPAPSDRGGVPPAAAPQAPAPEAGGRQAVDPALQRFVGTVVQVRTRAVPNGESVGSLGARRSGSGAILDPTTVLTIGYLLIEADSVDVVTASGRTIPASVAGYDHETGLGVVRTAIPLDGTPLQLGDSDSVDARHKVLTLGHGEPAATELVVLARKPFAGGWEYLLDRAIFTFPPVNNWSGAALMSSDGKLVGIGSLIVDDAAAERSGVPGNMFVPVNLVKPILADLLSKGRRDGPAQPWLGMTTESVRGNLMVSRLSRDGPAEQAGVAVGDIIVAVGEERVGGQAEFYRHVRKSGPAGTVIALRVLHGGTLRDVPVRSADRADFLRKPGGI